MAKRKRAEWNLQGKLPRPRCPRCRGDVLVVVANEWTAECAECGVWRKDQMGDYRKATTPGGREYWLVSNLAVIDEHPALLASKMPIFLDIEPAPNRVTWAQRVTALEQEREMRAKDKGRTVHGPASPTAR